MNEPIFCRDTEQVAELFNAGYQEAMKHKTGGAEHRAWLIQTAGQIIRNAFHALPPPPFDMIAAQVADALLTELHLDQDPDDLLA